MESLCCSGYLFSCGTPILIESQTPLKAALDEFSDEPPTVAAPTPAERAGPVMGSKPVTLIRPPAGWQTVNLGQLWAYRELLYFLVWRDVKIRYKQTVLGAAWAVIQPVMTMVVFSLFFGRLGRMSDLLPADLPYPVF